MLSSARVRFSLLSLFLLLPTWARSAPGTFTALPAESSVSYTAVHKLHKVVGVAKKLEGRARILPDGQVQAMVRVPVEAFDSGNGNRDAHVKESIGAARFPFVELKAVAQIDPNASNGTTTLKGNVTFHGVTRPVELPATFSSEGRRLSVTGTFPVSLEGHGVERPSLMFVKVDDRLEIAFQIVLEIQP
jgi:polyisoprenoid-binding protein YceI